MEYLSFLLIFTLFPALARQFELGTLYHYSYESKLDVRSFTVSAFPSALKLTGHVDVCSLWTNGVDELLRVEFHNLELITKKTASPNQHHHAASGVQSDFAIAHVQGNTVAGVYSPTADTNATLSALLKGFVALLAKDTETKQKQGRFVIKTRLENTFGGHHPVLIDVTEHVVLPLVGSDTVEPVTISTNVFSQLISTSDCSAFSVDGRDVDSAVEAIAARVGSPLSTLKETTTIKKDAKERSCSLADDTIPLIDCISSSSSIELHKQLFSLRQFSLPDLEPTRLRRYYSNMCIRTFLGEDVAVAAIVGSLKMANSLKDEAEIRQEIDFGVACLLNQICVGGQTTSCQRVSSLIFGHLQTSYKTCSKVGCQLAVVRAFHSCLENLPVAHSFIFQLATAKEQNPQIVAGCLRSLSVENWSPIESEIDKLIDFFENSKSIEIQFAALDLFLSSTAVTKTVENARKISKSLTKILSESRRKPTEFSQYLVNRLVSRLSSDFDFRKSILSQNGRLIFELLPAVANFKATCLFIEGPLFPTEALTFLLDAQNVAADSLVHSSFSVNSNSRRLFEVEIDSVGLDALISGFLSSDSAGEGTEKQPSATDVDPAATFTLKLNDGRVVGRHGDLFRGQDLMNAVWNAPSDPVLIASVNSTVMKLSDTVRLVNGLSVDVSTSVVVQVTFKGAVSISLWSQSAQTLISTIVKASAMTEFSIPLLGLSRSLDVDGTTHIAFQTDIGLGSSSGMPDVCLRMTREKTTFSSTKLRSTVKQTTPVVSSHKLAPASYAFHVYNSQNCAKLLNSGDSW